MSFIQVKTKKWLKSHAFRHTLCQRRPWKPQEKSGSPSHQRRSETGEGIFFVMVFTCKGVQGMSLPFCPKPHGRGLSCCQVAIDPDRCILQGLRSLVGLKKDWFCESQLYGKPGKGIRWYLKIREIRVVSMENSEELYLMISNGLIMMSHSNVADSWWFMTLGKPHRLVTKSQALGFDLSCHSPRADNKMLHTFTGVFYGCLWCILWYTNKSSSNLLKLWIEIEGNFKACAAQNLNLHINVLQNISACAKTPTWAGTHLKLKFKAWTTCKMTICIYTFEALFWAQLRCVSDFWGQIYPSWWHVHKLMS